MCFDNDAAACERIRQTCAAYGEIGARVQVQETYAGWEVNEAQNCTTLDVVASSEDGFLPDLVKVDVEGAELYGG